jgi:hypothetical protein
MILPKFNFSYFARIVQVAVHDLILLCGLFYEVLAMKVFENVVIRGVMDLGGRN